MIRKLTIFFAVILYVSACQKDETILKENDKNVNVKISLSMNEFMDQETGYTLMKSTRANPVNRCYTTNGFATIITKKIDHYWIVDTVIHKELVTGKGTGSFYLTDQHILNDVSLEMRPGTYRVVIITGKAFSTWSWNDQIKKGLVVEDTDITDYPVPFACKYKANNQNGFTNTDSLTLGTEVFSGMKQFEVKKTEDLHSDVIVNDVKVELLRKVSNYRMALRHITDGTVEPFHIGGQKYYIMAQFNTKKDTPFCQGLNIWGDPWYNPDKKMTSWWYCTEVYPDLVKGKDGLDYLVNSPLPTLRQYSSYMFTDPKVEVPITISSVKINKGYNLAEFFYLGSVTDTIKHNNIRGIAFRSSLNDLPGGYYFELFLEEDSNNIPINTATLFDDFIEYNLPDQ
ncbi:MAG: hypothetical protein LBQ60_09855 [Bacteroidales bacterium]|jgi:hypothetical protein|nr:hypothetical protein [Bacteroidales bacterium]